MIKEKLTAKKQIRRLRVEKKKVEAELAILKVAGVDSFPIASKVLSTKAIHLEGEIAGIRWMVNTNEKAGKKEVKKAKKAEKVEKVEEIVPATIEPKKAEVKTKVVKEKTATVKMDIKK